MSKLNELELVVFRKFVESTPVSTRVFGLSSQMSVHSVKKREEKKTRKDSRRRKNKDEEKKQTATSFCAEMCGKLENNRANRRCRLLVASYDKVVFLAPYLRRSETGKH